MPQEIGYAAAYEAYRQLKYSSSVYNSVYTDYERQRETQRALAIAEGVSPSICFISHASRNLPHHPSLTFVARRGSWDGPIRLTDGMRCCRGNSR
jgi:hypothetical protein